MNYNYDIEQNTPEWETLKLGRFSASYASDLLMDPKCEGYKKLIKRIIEERVTGKPSEAKWSGNQFTERGLILEPVAREAFEIQTFTKVHKVGFIELDGWTSCSPDGIIGTDTLIQIKCPIFSTQLDYLEDQKIPGEYYKQMQFELMVCEREFNIFYSYHPNLPAVTIKTARDEKLIREIRTKLPIAIETVKQRMAKIGVVK